MKICQRINNLKSNVTGRDADVPQPTDISYHLNKKHFFYTNTWIVFKRLLSIADFYRVKSLECLLVCGKPFQYPQKQAVYNFSLISISVLDTETQLVFLR